MKIFDRQAGRCTLVLLVALLAACGGDPDAPETERQDASGVDSREQAGRPDATASKPRFDPRDLPADATLERGQQGQPFRSDREAVEAFEGAYRDVDLNRMQELWWRMNAVQRFAAHEAGKALSDAASMGEYQRMLPAEYLLDAESLPALQAAAEREARGEEAVPAASTAPAPAGPGTVPAVERGVLRGVVVVEGSGEPVEGVQLIASPTGAAALQLLLGQGENLSAVSAADGSFEIAGVPAGEVSLVGQKLPHYPLISHRTTAVAQEVVEVRVELPPVRAFELELPVVIAGVVRDELSGEPVAGVHVSAGRHGGATSDERGRYLIAEADLGEIELATEHVDYLPFRSLVLAEKRGRIDHDLTIQPITTGILEGIVVDSASGAPLAGATVALLGTELTTDSEGRFRLEEVEAGEITLTGHVPRYRSAVGRVQLARRTTAEARLELDPITEGTVVGVVTDASTGRPLAGAQVEIGRQAVETGPEGRFEFADVPAGEVNVTADKEVFESAGMTIEVEAADTVELALALEPITYGTLTGIVVDGGSGRPVPGAVVAARGRTANTDERGRFELDRVPAGELQLSASRPVYESAIETLTLDPAATLDRRLVLAPILYGRLTGQVVDADSLRPLGGVEVSVSDRSLTTGADGRFEVERIDAGRLTISAHKPAYQSGGTAVTLEPAGAVDARVELEPIRRGTVGGVVRDAHTGEPIAGARVAVGGLEVETDAQGRFEVPEVEAGSVGVSARHADYGDGAASGELSGAAGLELDIQLDLRREDVTQLESALASKGTIDLYGIHFDSGDDQFKPSSLGTLNAVLQVIRRAPERTFRIAGHTDSDGTNAYNQDLSERRARTVMGWLVERGIERERLQLAGYGESRPAAPNDTPSGKALNRRVELGYAR